MNVANVSSSSTKGIKHTHDSRSNNQTRSILENICILYVCSAVHCILYYTPHNSVEHGRRSAVCLSLCLSVAASLFISLIFSTFPSDASPIPRRCVMSDFTLPHFCAPPTSSGRLALPPSPSLYHPTSVLFVSDREAKILNIFPRSVLHFSCP